MLCAVCVDFKKCLEADDILHDPQTEGAREFGLLALELLNLLVDAIKLGIKDGTVSDDLDPLQTAIFLVVTAEASINLTPVYENLVTQKHIGRDEYLQHSIDLMLQGIASNKLEKNSSFKPVSSIPK